MAESHEVVDHLIHSEAHFKSYVVEKQPLPDIRPVIAVDRHHGLRR